MKLRKKIYILFGIWLMTLSTYVVYKNANQPRVGYINSYYLFENFEYKLELEQRYERTEKARQLYIDSLKNDLANFGKYLETNETLSEQEKFQQFNSKRGILQQKEVQFEQDERVQSAEYDEKIISRLTEYLATFSKEKEIDILIGHNEKGSFVFSSAAYDFTQEALNYINKRYSGSEI